MVTKTHHTEAEKMSLHTDSDMKQHIHFRKDDTNIDDLSQMRQQCFRILCAVRIFPSRVIPVTLKKKMAFQCLPFQAGGVIG